MKIRTGFVSNSSTQSFICPLCNDNYEIMDGDPENDTYDLCICENHHSFCQIHIPFTIEEILITMRDELIKKKHPIEVTLVKDIDTYSPKELKKLFDRENADKEGMDKLSAINLDNFIHYFFSHLPVKLCPICTFKRILPCDIKDYFFITAEIDTVLSNLEKTFGTYEKFQKFLDKNRNINLDWNKNEN